MKLKAAAPLWGTASRSRNYVTACTAPGAAAPPFADAPASTAQERAQPATPARFAPGKCGALRCAVAGCRPCRAEIAAEARARSIRPWILVKERIAGRVLDVMARDDRAVLQGGAALHFAYGSPRLSADVAFVGENVATALADRGPELASAASREV